MQTVSGPGGRTYPVTALPYAGVMPIKLPFMVLALLVLALPANAQMPETVVTTGNAPIYVSPDTTHTPLRVAASGTVLRVLVGPNQAPDGWYRVQFEDPRWGRRVGFVEVRFVRARPADYSHLEPLDLSVRDDAPALPNTAPLVAGTDRLAPPIRQPYFSSGPPPLRGYAMAIGGLTFGTEAAPLAGGEVAGMVTPWLAVYGTFGYHHNVLPAYIQDAFDDLSTLLSLATGEDWQFTMRTRAWYGLGGAKVFIPTGSTVRPYALGGIGFARLTTTIREIDLGDVTDDIVDLSGLDDDDLNPTKPLWEVGGGVSIPLGRAYVDAGYRYRRLIDVGEPFNISGVYGGVGVSF